MTSVSPASYPSGSFTAAFVEVDRRRVESEFCLATWALGRQEHLSE